jgi:hypothetical protein
MTTAINQRGFLIVQSLQLKAESRELKAEAYFFASDRM